MRFGGFGPAAFQFLRDLGRHNEKAWFEANREVYEREVREPMRRLVEALDARLGGIAPEIVGDPKRSMFRIHRDVRFSQNKSPYKTNAGAWLYPEGTGFRPTSHPVSSMEGFGEEAYSTFTPATLMSLANLSLSSRRNLPSSSGVVPIVSSPSSASFAFTSSSFNARLMPELSVLTTAAGVPLGTKYANQFVATKPGAGRLLGGQRPSLGDYVTGPGARNGGGLASVAYALRLRPVLALRAGKVHRARSPLLEERVPEVA